MTQHSDRVTPENTPFPMTSASEEGGHPQPSPSHIQNLIERLDDAAQYINDLKSGEHIPDDVQGSLYDTLSEAAQALQDNEKLEHERDIHDAVAAIAKEEVERLRQDIEKLRAERDLVQSRLDHAQQWYATRHERLWHWAHEKLTEGLKKEYFDIVANGTITHPYDPPTYAQQMNTLRHRLERAEKSAEASEQQCEALKSALLNRIRCENGCVSVMVDAEHCTGWDAEKCGCAVEARSALSLPLPSGQDKLRCAITALEKIHSGRIAGEENSHRDTLQVMRGIAEEALQDILGPKVTEQSDAQ